MNVAAISTESIRAKKIAVLGYGNQGRAHALNLMDSGVSVVVGARPGPSAEKAQADGCKVVSFTDAVKSSDIVMFLLPDQVIPQVYKELQPLLTAQPKWIGFAHGFAVVFGLIEKTAGCSYFLVGPKGAGALLRENFLKGGGLPGVFAVEPGAVPGTDALAMSYAKAMGCASSVLLKTTFREETECDLFGEQAVLCGGFMETMEAAFETLVEAGHTPEMAFFETCFEARMILELWMKYGPVGMAGRISPTAFYGGISRAPRIVPDSTKKEMRKIFSEIREGQFCKEWMEEVRQGMPKLAAEKSRLKESLLQKTWEKLSPKIN